MNIPIRKELAQRLDLHVNVSFVYGSRLFNVHTPESDYDIIALYVYDDVFDQQYFLPNQHSFQYTDTENNKDIIYMTYEQFWNAFYNADGTMYADIILFSNWYSNKEALSMCRSYKIIKGYCGTSKRDLTNVKDAKVIKRSAKNLYIASCLLNNEYPSLKQIQKLYKSTLNVEYLLEQEQLLRTKAQELFNQNTLPNYVIPTTEDELLNIMLHGNNLKEYIFKK